MMLKRVSVVLLCAIAAPAGGEDKTGSEADPKLDGPWGLHRFLDPYGYSMWTGFCAGSTKTMDVSVVMIGITERKSHMHRVKVVSLKKDRMVIQERMRYYDEKDRPKGWRRPLKLEFPLEPIRWKVETLGELNYETVQRVIPAKRFRVTVTAGDMKQIWMLVATPELGVLEAVRKEPPGVTWRLKNLDEPYLFHKRKLVCRGYELLHDEPKDAEIGHIGHKRLLLCEQVPGYVVQAQYKSIGRYTGRLAAYKGKLDKPHK